MYLKYQEKKNAAKKNVPPPTMPSFKPYKNISVSSIGKSSKDTPISIRKFNVTPIILELQMNDLHQVN